MPRNRCAPQEGVTCLHGCMHRVESRPCAPRRTCGHTRRDSTGVGPGSGGPRRALTTRVRAATPGQPRVRAPGAWWCGSPRVRVGSYSGVPPCDWEDRATWAAARRDVGAVSVTSQPDLAVPGAVKTVRSYAGLAVQIGTRRLGLLSGRGEEARQCAEHTATPGVWGTQR